MRFTETMQVTMLSCDRCDKRVSLASNPQGWLVANVALTESPTATVEHHLCGECREALGAWLANREPEQDHLPDGPPHWCERCNRGEHGNVDERGICECCNTVMDGYAYFRQQRERLGL